MHVILLSAMLTTLTASAGPLPSDARSACIADNGLFSTRGFLGDYKIAVTTGDKTKTSIVKLVSPAISTLIVSDD